MEQRTVNSRVSPQQAVSAKHRPLHAAAWLARATLSIGCMRSAQAKTTVTPALKTRLFTVCLTGGPCSGKSSSLASFTKALTEKGFDVYAVPEVRRALRCPFQGVR